MGQAWCKERSAKAHDSKSPLDRVFVRCAHTIYPGLKEEGSVFGSPTQRVNSSELDFASLPRKPRTALRRGHSIDSVDRPFHPSDWVDVNLEVPCEPSPPPYLLRFAARQQQQQQQLLQANGRPDQPPRRSSDAGLRTTNAEDRELSGTQPVPPPRRRRRRHNRRPESSSLPHYKATPNDSKSLPITESSRCNNTNRSSDGLDDALTADSDDEFIQIERSLQKSSRPKQQLESGPPGLTTTTTTTTTRQKKRSSTSLPGDAAAEQRQTGSYDAKSASLPRDAGACPQIDLQGVETWKAESTGPSLHRSSCSLDTEDNTRSHSLVDENSIADLEDVFLGQVEATSTPLKAEPPPQAHSQNSTPNHEKQPTRTLGEVESEVDEDAEKDHLDVVPIHVLKFPPNVQRVEVVNESSPCISSMSQLTRSQGDDSTRSDLYHDAAEDLSSAVASGATAQSCDDSGSDLQRTISEESLPREMLVEESVDESCVVDPASERTEPRKSDPSSRRSSDDTIASDSFNTPPPSPEPTAQPKTQTVATMSNGLTKPEECPKLDRRSVSPNPSQLRAALIDICALDTHSEADELKVDVRKMKTHSQQDQDVSIKQSSKPPRPSPPEAIHTPRLNPFDFTTGTINDITRNSDSLIDEEIAVPEKPARMHQQQFDYHHLHKSLIDESPLIIPTPPRRSKQKSRSSLSPNVEIVSAYGTYDRLI